MKRGTDDHKKPVSDTRGTGRRPRDQSAPKVARRKVGSRVVSRANWPKRRTAGRRAAKTREKRPVASSPPGTQKAFLNLPFHKDYEKICVALASGLVCFGVRPTIVTEVIGSRVRLDRLVALIGGCDFSFHDLSYLRRDGRRRVPRFNIAFELGLAVVLNRDVRGEPAYYIFEARQHRLQESLSDLNGVDPLIHSGTAVGVLRSLLNRFSREDPGRQRPTFELLRRVHRQARKLYSSLKSEYGWIFEPACFGELVYGTGLILHAEMSQQPPRS